LSEKLYTAALASPFVILAIQVVVWLHSAEWLELPFGYVILKVFPGVHDPTAWINAPSSWLGAHRILSWLIETCPLHLAAAVLIALLGLVMQGIEEMGRDLRSVFWGSRRRRRAGVRPQF
jgi:hypothetical protein